MRPFHLLYTNCRGADGQGFRVLRLPAPELPEAELRQLEQKVRGVEPLGELGVATGMVRLGGRPWLLMTLAAAAFGRDDVGRAAQLRHLVAVELAEGKARAAGNPLPALWARLEGMWRQLGASGSLEAWQEACADWQEVGGELAAAGGAELAPELWSLLGQWAAPQPPAELPLAPAVTTAEWCRALGFLPPRLRYGASWSRAARASGATLLTPVAAPVAAPERWPQLLDQLGRRAPLRLAELSESWEITSLKAFERELEAALSQEEQIKMANPRPASPPPLAPQPPQLPPVSGPALPANEAAAAERRLRLYVDERLGGIAEKLFEPPSFYQRYKVEIWGVAILLVVAALHLLAPAPAARPAATAAGAVITIPAQSTTPPPSAAARPAELWPEWVKGHAAAVAASLGELPNDAQIGRGVLSEAQKSNAEKLVKQLGQVAALDPRDLAFPDLRLLLFEYLVRKEAKTLSLKIDGKIDLLVGDKEYPAAELAKIAQKHSVKASPSARDADFQAELVMACLSSAQP